MEPTPREFWSAVAQKYDRVVDLQIGGRTRLLLRDRLEKEGVLGRVVEFGCGTGFFTSALATKASTMAATDLSPTMIALARKQVGADNVTFQPEDCQNTSFADSSFDTAFLGLVLHFTEPKETLREMRRILKPGGVLIISNIDLAALTGFHRLRAIARMIYQGLIGYRTRPPRRLGRNMLSEPELCGMLRRCGFEILGTERIMDLSRSTNIPIDYVTARRLQMI